MIATFFYRTGSWKQLRFVNLTITRMKFRPFSICVALLFVVTLTACKNNLNDPGAGAAERNDQEIKDYLLANQLQNQVTASSTGLYYVFTDTTSTRNKKAQYNEEVEFTYTLSSIDGNKTKRLDSTNQIQSIYVPFFRGVLVPGLEEGLLLMKEGQRALFFMPSTIAFGPGYNNIPKYVPVVFDVELKRSRTQTEQIQDYSTRKQLGTPLQIPVTGSSDNVWVYRLTPGSGGNVTEGQTVTIAYTASTLRGTTPFAKQDTKDVSTAATQTTDVKGLATGLTALNVGDKALLIFASSLGYGTQGIVEQSNYIVPPYAPLVYEVTVKSAK